MSQLETNHWKEDLERLLNSSLDRNPGDLITDLCDLASAMGYDDAEALLDAHPSFFDHAPALTRRNYQRVLTKDTAEAQHILQQDIVKPTPFRDVASKAVAVTYDRVGDMFDQIEFSDCHRLVMVGCGSVPTTIFHIHDKTTIPEIVGLDIVPEAIEMSRTLTEWLGYSRVRTELHNGLSYDYSQAQIVFVANMVSPKASVVSRIADTAPDNVQIIVREPMSLGRLWAEGVDKNLDPRLEVTRKGRAGGFGAVSRDLYLKRRAIPASQARSD